MQYKRLDHVVIVVNDVIQATRDYERLLGIPGTNVGRERADQGYRDTMFYLGDSGSFVELCEPTDDRLQAGAAMRRRLNQQGEGIQNIALAVDNVDEAIARAEAEGIQIIRSKHSHSFFLHPRSTHGPLIQILQR